MANIKTELERAKTPLPDSSHSDARPDDDGDMDIDSEIERLLRRKEDRQAQQPTPTLRAPVSSLAAVGRTGSDSPPSAVGLSAKASTASSFALQQQHAPQPPQQQPPRRDGARPAPEGRHASLLQATTAAASPLLSQPRRRVADGHGRHGADGSSSGATAAATPPQPPPQTRGSTGVSEPASASAAGSYTTSVAKLNSDAAVIHGRPPRVGIDWSDTASNLERPVERLERHIRRSISEDDASKEAASSGHGSGGAAAGGSADACRSRERLPSQSPTEKCEEYLHHLQPQSQRASLSGPSSGSGNAAAAPAAAGERATFRGSKLLSWEDIDLTNLGESSVLTETRAVPHYAGSPTTGALGSGPFEKSPAPRSLSASGNKPDYHKMVRGLL